MDPVIDNEWLNCKNEPVEETQNVGNIARSWQWREHGIDPAHYPPNKKVLENVAENILVQKQLNIRSCDLPGYPRSTYLMVFSPDGTKVASTHGNHNVYVSELASGKHVRILTGHPRTPWCIAFHPSHPLLIGSGCLGGQVRVWDIASGGSEVWNVRNETVIASIAFHPREQLLVIATYNELYFWDWSHPAPFTRVSTNNVNEKVRYVAFDALGYKLITGISLWTCPGGPVSSSLLQQAHLATVNAQNNSARRDDSDDSPGGSRPQENAGSQDMIVNSYQNLVQRYDSLVRNYQRLFMVRHRLTNTPPPPNTIDRGTDPMETDVSPGTSGSSRSSRSSAVSTPNDDANPTPSTSRQYDAGDRIDSEISSSRLLNLDVLTFDPPRARTNSVLERTLFGSRSSAFQPLNSSERNYRTLDQRDNTTRLLPNPFSSSSGSSLPTRVSFSDGTPPSNSTNTSRTSIFTSRSGLGRDFAFRRRNSPLPRNQDNRNNNPSTSTERSTSPANGRQSNPGDSVPSTSGTSTRRPTMTNSSTQMSPVSTPVDAQTINESLDLIRDILRDSGTRLLNLITNMSLSTLASVERSIPRRGNSSRAHSDDSEGGERTRGGRPRVRLLSSSWRRDLLSTSSDSDSDQSPEVNIFRTRNSTFQEDDSRDNERASAPAPSERLTHPTDRMVFELNNETRNESSSRDAGGINVTLSNNRFRVRTQSDSANNDAGSSGNHAREERGTSESRIHNPPESDRDRPSTSRDDFWARGTVVPPEEAYRRVKSGVTALQKHTTQLTNLWLRGNRTTMRELRTMWESLRRRILTLHRETGGQDVPSYYTRPLLDRCMMLTDMTDNLTRPAARNPRTNPRNDDMERPTSSRNSSQNSDNMTSNTASGSNSAADNATENTPTGGRASQVRGSPNLRSSPALRRKIQTSHRWRAEDELRRRSRNPTANRLYSRYANKSRRDLPRAIEISATRHEIRMRAMQVLSVMFNMMMMCLEERGLSQLIITMLRTLKRALALTCLIVMSNRNTGRPGTSNTAPAPQRVESLDVVRIQNVDHTGPVNVDGPDDLAAANNSQSAAQPGPSSRKKSADNPTSADQPTSKLQRTVINSDRRGVNTLPPSLNAAAQRWSNRLAVQIAAANRNNSLTARRRRDLYLECKRQKALHRTNPAAHPFIRRRALPPVSNYRIPALRSVPGRSIPRLRSPRIVAESIEPVAGPSNAQPPNDTSGQDSPGSEINDPEHRVNYIRIAHMQAVRLRNAARNRFRRLQTIRLYTPSSVREMFALQTNNAERSSENRSPSNGEGSNRHPLAMFRPHILTPRGDPNRSDEGGHFHTVLNNVAMPFMQMNEGPANAEGQQGTPPQRLPRIHEYLQPIILAQNAMVVDEEGNNGDGANGGSGGGGGGGSGGPPGGGGLGGARRMSGMAGLLDAGIISEALPAPSHRVQAWDFTTGDTPQIGDSTKNVVVQRCRIHNDASIDISKDGRLLVALLPVPRMRNNSQWLGVYSLEWARLGQCLHTAVLEQSAVSVALSPTARHLAVGLGSRRFATAAHSRPNAFALLYRLEPLESSSRTGLLPIRELEQNWEHGFTSLNCLRWAPQPGQGLVYANNTGQLIIMN